MRRLLQFAALLLLACPAHAVITVAVGGTNGTNSTNVASLTAPSSGTYNQAAGHCIVVTADAYQKNIAFSDVAGDSFTAVVPQYTGGNSWNEIVGIAYNTAGSSVNTVKATYSTGDAQYATIDYFDVNIGAACTSSALDVAMHITTISNLTSGSSVTATLTTAQANEAIVTMISCHQSNLNAATAPAGFTSEGGQNNSISEYAYLAASAIQTNVVWTNVQPSSSTNYVDMVVVSLEAPSTSACKPTLTLLGVGRCG